MDIFDKKQDLPLIGQVAAAVKSNITEDIGPNLASKAESAVAGLIGNLSSAEAADASSLSENISASLAAGPTEEGATSLHSMLVTELNLEDYFSRKENASAKTVVPTTAEKISLESYNNAMKQATMTAIATASESTSKTYAKEFRDDTVDSSNGIVLGNTIGADIGNLSFDGISYDGLAELNVVSNALIAAGDAVLHSNYAPLTYGPEQNGTEISIRLPYIYTPITRKADGTPVKEVRESLLNAPFDRSILSKSTNKVIPDASHSGIDDVLIDPSIVANHIVPVAEKPVATRPFKTGVEIDIIGATTAVHIVGSSNRDRTDTLSKTARVGSIIAKIGKGENSAAVRIPTKSVSGSLFTTVSEGSDRERTVNLTFRHIIRSTRLTADAEKDSSGVTLASVLTGLAEELTLAAGTKYSMEVKVVAQAHIDEQGVAMLHVASITPSRVFNDSDKEIVDPAALTALKGYSFVGEGWEIDTTTSGTNQRNPGLLADAGTKTKVILTCTTGEPISTVSQGDGAENDAIAVDSLTRLVRTKIINETNAHIFDSIESIRAWDPLSDTAVVNVGAGSLLISPTLVEDAIDAKAMTVIRTSAGALDDLRHAITNTCTAAASKLLEQTNYRSITRQLGAPENGFEIVINCNERIANLMNTTSDMRSLGNDLKHVFVPNPDKEFGDKIVMVVRRINPPANDLTSWGKFVSIPSLMYRTMGWNNGSSQKVIQVIPRHDHHLICPMAAVVKLENLDGVFNRPVA